MTRVKVLSRKPAVLWLRCFPNGEPRWGDLVFCFDPHERHYDWLVVYDDFGATQGAASDAALEVLACPDDHTLLITTEPASIKSYGRSYTAQFRHVITTQPAWALPHRGRIFSQTGNHWFYGQSKKHIIGYNELANAELAKTLPLSTVCSSKRQRMTLHNQRVEFTNAIKAEIPELEIFGHGVRSMDDKAEALSDYRYHLAIENYHGEHHWTEKLSDCFLALSLPFYYGAPNASDYFPAEAMIPIDLYDVAGSVATMRAAMAAHEYEKRLPYLLQAREQVLQRHGFIPLISQHVLRLSGQDQASGKTLYSRHLLRRKKPLIAVEQVLEKLLLSLANTADFLLRQWRIRQASST